MTIVWVVGTSLVAVLAAVSLSQEPGTGASDEPKTVLLLVTGQVLKGDVQELDDGYVVRHKVGVIHKRRRDVQGAFESLDAAYKYLRDRTPERDPDERLKLAFWCLGQNLAEQAKSELEAVIAISPENPRAQAMLANLELRKPDAADADANVLRAAAEDPAAPPGELKGIESLRALYAQGGRKLGLPVIYDLPAPLAVRRYQEFARGTHRELQRHCAKCHHDQFPGEFRLYLARSTRDLNDELVLRANLDATLRLINPDDPARSPLLTAAGMTHGPDGKPVLGGPNHPSYRVLANWAASLKHNPEPLQPPDAPAPPRAIAPEAPNSDTFAKGRGANPSSVTTSSQPPSDPPGTIRITPQVLGGTQGTLTRQAPSVPSDVSFPENPLTAPSQNNAADRTPTPPRSFDPGARAADLALPKPPGTKPMPEVAKPGMVRLPSGEFVEEVTRDMTLKAAPKSPPATPESEPAKTDSAKTKSTTQAKSKALNSKALELFLKNRGR
jgi:hypothetical protein